jgi:hypothetical protein
MLPLIAIVLSASPILPYLTKKPARQSIAAATSARPPIRPVSFPRTVPMRHFVKP